MIGEPDLLGRHRRPPTTPTDNPFNPGFGVSPPVLAGRDALIAGLVARLHKHPGRNERLNVLVGARGVGKTVVLTEIRERMRRDRWLILTWSGARPLAQHLIEQEPRLHTELRGFLRRNLGRLNPELTVKAAPSGVGGELRLDRGDTPNVAPSVLAVLERLGEAAAARNRSILIAVDELQAAAPADLRAFTDALQELANVCRLPLALVAVGLPRTGSLLKSSAVSPGFAERLEPVTVEGLDEQATRDALEIPIVEAGRHIEAAALDILVTASGGYPYAIQLIGYDCWQLADTPTITRGHAVIAAEQVATTLEGQIFEPRWEAVRRADRPYLIAAAQLVGPDGTISTRDLARALGKSSTTALSPTRDRLINEHHLLTEAGRGLVRFAVPGLAAWIRRQQPSHHVGQPRPQGRDHLSRGLDL